MLSSARSAGGPLISWDIAQKSNLVDKVRGITFDGIYNSSWSIDHCISSNRSCFIFDNSDSGSAPYAISKLIDSVHDSLFKVLICDDNSATWNILMCADKKLIDNHLNNK